MTWSPPDPRRPGVLCAADARAWWCRVRDRVGSFLGFWRRDDVVAVLEGAGVVVGHEHRLNSPAEIEAAYPGATAWVERSKVRLYGVVTPPLLVGVFFLVWLLEP